MMGFFLLALCLHVYVAFGRSAQVSVSYGKCLNATFVANSYDVNELSGVHSLRHCAYLCSSSAQKCVAWSYKGGSCNISFSPHLLLYNQSDCVYYSRLEELQVFAYWPLSNHSRERNYGSAGAAFDAVQMGNVTYESDSARIDGSTPGEQGFNISQISSLSLTEFTFSVWVKHVNTIMAIFEAVNAAHTTYGMRVWFFASSSELYLYDGHKGSGGVILTTSSGIATPNAWNFITVYGSKTNRDFFMNGIRVSSFNEDSRFDAITGETDFRDEVYLATTKTARVHTYQFTGYMKCAMFSSKIFSDEEVQEVMTYCQ